MKRKLIFILLLGLLVCTGCNKGHDIKENTGTTETTPISIGNAQTESSTDIDEPESTTVEEETTTEYIPDEKKGYGRVKNRTYADEDMKRLGVEKKLVILCNKWTALLPDKVASKFNELLVNKYGCDFVVEFMGFDHSERNGNESDYSKALYEIKEMGQQADIIVTGSGDAIYTTIIEEGFLWELTDSLKCTEDGKLLYDALAENTWECVKRNGKIYGAPRARNYSLQLVLVCNKTLADSLGIEVPEGFSFYDIGEILAPYEQELNRQKIIGLYYQNGFLIEMLGYRALYDSKDMFYGVCAKKDDNREWSVFNPLLDEAFIKLCKSVREYRESWMCYDGTESDLEKIKIASGGNFLFYVDLVDGESQIQGNKAYTEKLGVVDIVLGDVIRDYYIMQQEINVKGIASWSQYKEEALKLLRILHTEEEICNLLVYGIEDEHYYYVNNEVILRNKNDKAMGLRDAHILNTYLTHPIYLESDNKAEYYKGMIGNLQADPLMQYGITYLEYDEITGNYSELISIAKQYVYGLLRGQYEDVDAAVAEAVKLQEEAGINELINKLNIMFESGAN